MAGGGETAVFIGYPSNQQQPGDEDERRPVLACGRMSSARAQPNSDPQPTKTNRFYERHGFTPVEWTDGAGNEERAPDVRYVWKPT